MRIIAGLGNPGREYRLTRHNVGWMALDALAERCRAGPEEARCDGVAVRTRRLVLFKPLRMMNLSGPPAAQLLRAEGVSVEDLLVLVDDVNLPLGTVRIRAGGSDGGHNGLASLVEALATEQFARLRLGIGPCPVGTVLRDYVLSPFEEDEEPAVEHMIARAVEAARCWDRRGMQAAMERFNRRDDQWPAPDGQ